MILKKFLFFPLFFPEAILSLRSRMYPKPLIYDEKGLLLECCSSPVLHNIVGGRCVWCDRTKAELMNLMDDQVAGVSLAPQQPSNIPQPDFNSPTTATANAPIPLPVDVVDGPAVVEGLGSVEKMSLNGVQAYCLKCRVRVVVLDPKTEILETRRGNRTYLKGTCASCGSKINAIVGVKK